MRLLFIALLILIPSVTIADIASTQYVQTHTATKVDTSEQSNQTMAGKYNVTGTITVPTPALPE